MDLTDYLRGIANCPDTFVASNNTPARALLTTEFGIFYSFPLFLQADFSKVLLDLELLGYHLIHTEADVSYSTRPEVLQNLGIPSSGALCALLNAPDLPTYLTVANYVPLGLATGRWPKHFDIQSRMFSICVLVHSSETAIPVNPILRMRALATSIQDLCAYAISARLPLCLPRSRGWDTLQDPERIVYYIP